MKKINVTKTFLPPISEYESYLSQIWARGQLTNQGPLLLDLEKKIEDYLHVKNFHFITNGTLALQLAIQALDLSGDIITTPFSYVATTSAILWEHCNPIFVDIDPSSFCIDPTKIEEAITPSTSAILAVHVFGYPCDIEQIQKIAEKYRVKVIYDAAHAFGVEYKGKSLLSYGDVATCSFHATKLFHTIEGGGIVVKSNSVSDKVELSKRFGHNVDEHFMMGINAKASEFQAAMGLSNLPYIDELIQKRRYVSELYSKLLSKKFQTRKLPNETKYNFSYYPIVFTSEKNLMAAIEELNNNNIFPRRYFYPSLNTLPYLQPRSNCPVSESISRRILCLPLYDDLSVKEVKKIAEITNKNA